MLPGSGLDDHYSQIHQLVPTMYFYRRYEGLPLQCCSRKPYPKTIWMNWNYWWNNIILLWKPNSISSNLIAPNYEPKWSFIHWYRLILNRHPVDLGSQPSLISKSALQGLPPDNYTTGKSPQVNLIPFSGEGSTVLDTEVTLKLNRFKLQLNAIKDELNNTFAFSIIMPNQWRAWTGSS